MVVVVSGGGRGGATNGCPAPPRGGVGFHRRGPRPRRSVRLGAAGGWRGGGHLCSQVPWSEQEPAAFPRGWSAPDFLFIDLPRYVGQAMGRTESPLDPTTGPLAAVAQELRELRHAAGSPSYRALARRAGYSAAALSAAASGASLPPLSVTLAYVGACGGPPARQGARRR